VAKVLASAGKQSHNLRRTLNILCVEAMMAAVGA
jgi:hypothetical protein